MSENSWNFLSFSPSISLPFLPPLIYLPDLLFLALPRSDSLSGSLSHSKGSSNVVSYFTTYPKYEYVTVTMQQHFSTTGHKFLHILILALHMYDIIKYVGYFLTPSL